MKEVIGKPKKYGFNVNENHYYPKKAYRTITLDTAIADLVSFAHSQGVTYKTLRDYNGWINDIALGNKKGKKYTFKLPKKGDWSPDMNKTVQQDTSFLDSTAVSGTGEISRDSFLVVPDSIE